MSHHPRAAAPTQVHRLSRARSLARLLDRSFRVPGTSIRFGLDPLLGLLPGGGDVLAALGSGYILYVAWREGAPSRLIRRMLANVVIDTLVGTVPVLGDVFDAGWKSNSRNVRMLEDWAGAEPAGRDHGVLLLLAIVLVLALLLAAVLAGVWWVARVLLG